VTPTAGSEPRVALLTDSCCDLPVDFVLESGLEVLHFPYEMDGKQRLDDMGETLSHADFYDEMRAGAQPTTAQIPRPTFLDAFRTHAAAGRPVVYLGFSSGLSSTFDGAFLARQDVLADFPDAEIHLVDTLSASCAEGLIVYEAVKRWHEGWTAADIAEWTERERMRMNGFFTLDQLESLRRGGRIPDAAAAAGAMLDIKPFLTLDANGKLALKRAIRGRKKSVRALADIMEERGQDLASQTIGICHGGCPEDAEMLRTLVTARIDVGDVLMMHTGPVIGAHTGPGMLAVVFWGAAR
jgi:DegV family protein with EDD domain